MEKSPLTIAIGILLSLSLITLLGRFHEGSPMLGVLVGADLEETRVLSELYDDSPDTLNLELACATLNRGIYTQADVQQKIHWQAAFLTLDCPFNGEE